MEDNNTIAINQGIKVFHEFYPELIDLWNALYNDGANYNLSYEWCYHWFKHFGKNRKPYIVAFFENKELKLLAPLYLFKNQLSLIGTKPDLYDEFNILYKDAKYIDKLLEFIEKSKLELNLKHVNSETEFAKALVKRFSGTGIKFASDVTETKPYLLAPFEPKGPIVTDIKRCEKNILKKLSKEYEFESDAEKSEANIEEFIRFHIHRWDGGMLVKKKNLIDFVREVIKLDVCKFSRLYIKDTNETAAYGIGFLDSNNKYWLSMPTYNAEYKPFSPGKVFLFKLIENVMENGTTHFDFGRGSEPYKNWFANSQAILFNVLTVNNVYYYKVLNLINKILKKIF